MKFRFESILRLRKTQENLVQRDLAEINGHIQNQEDRLHFMEDVENNSKAGYNQRLKQAPNIEMLLLHDRFLLGIKSQEQLQSRIIGEAQKQLELKRQLLVEAVRKRRTLEILKERQLAEFNRVLKKRETAQMDEIAANISRRQPL